MLTWMVEKCYSKFLKMVQIFSLQESWRIACIPVINSPIVHEKFFRSKTRTLRIQTRSQHMKIAHVLGVRKWGNFFIFTPSNTPKRFLTRR